jgi:hypothetical protein
MNSEGYQNALEGGAEIPGSTIPEKEKNELSPEAVEMLGIIDAGIEDNPEATLERIAAADTREKVSPSPELSSDGIEQDPLYREISKQLIQEWEAEHENISGDRHHDAWSSWTQGRDTPGTLKEKVLEKFISINPSRALEYEKAETTRIYESFRFDPAVSELEEQVGMSIRTQLANYGSQDVASARSAAELYAYQRFAEKFPEKAAAYQKDVPVLARILAAQDVNQPLGEDRNMDVQLMPEQHAYVVDGSQKNEQPKGGRSEYLNKKREDLLSYDPGISEGQLTEVLTRAGLIYDAAMSGTIENARAQVHGMYEERDAERARIFDDLANQRRQELALLTEPGKRSEMEYLIKVAEDERDLSLADAAERRNIQHGILGRQPTPSSAPGTPFVEASEPLRSEQLPRQQVPRDMGRVELPPESHAVREYEQPEVPVSATLEEQPESIDSADYFSFVQEYLNGNEVSDRDKESNSENRTNFTDIFREYFGNDSARAWKEIEQLHNAFTINLEQLRAQFGLSKDEQSIRKAAMNQTFERMGVKGDRLTEVIEGHTPVIEGTGGMKGSFAYSGTFVMRKMIDAYEKRQKEIVENSRKKQS